MSRDPSLRVEPLSETPSPKDAQVVGGHTHSSTPWVIPHGDDNGHVVCEGDDPKNPGRILFILRNPSGTSRVLSFEELSANAAFIVRAVNSHKANEAKIAAAVKALERAQELVRLLNVRQVIEAGDDAINAAGLNPWAMNEGLAEGHETLNADFIEATLSSLKEGK